MTTLSKCYESLKQRQYNPSITLIQLPIIRGYRKTLHAQTSYFRLQIYIDPIKTFFREQEDYFASKRH